MMNTVSLDWNDNKITVEGTFSLSAAAAVLSQTAGLTSKTVTGQGMSVVKNGTGRYDVTMKTASALDGKPSIQPVEFLYGNANIVATTVATVLDCRILGVPTITANGDITFSVITAQTTGAAADTTAAILVSFMVVFAVNRMDQVL